MALTLLILYGAGWYGLEIIQISKERELQRHMEGLGALARPRLAAATTHLLARVEAVESQVTEPGDWTREAGLIDELNNEGAFDDFVAFAADAGLRGVTLIDTRGRVLIDTAEPRRDFSPYELLELDREPFEAALAGEPGASPAYDIADDSLKRLYVPLLDDSDDTVAALCLVAGRDYLGEMKVLTSRLRWVLAATTTLTLLVGVVLYRLLARQRRLERQAARADRLSGLGELAAGFAHEIRNPLGVIGACAEDVAHVLRHEADDATEREAAVDSCADILGEVQRLNRLVERFLQFARAERDNESPAAPARVRATLDSALGMLRRAAEQKSVTLDWEPGDLSPDWRALISEDGLRQIAINLTLNAIQATPENGRVQIGLEAGHRSLTLWIEDSGPGIPPELRSRVFDPFFTTRPEGTGLGLSIAHQIATGAAGSLELGQSSMGGARFEVRLRRAPDAAPEPSPAAPGFHVAADEPIPVTARPERNGGAS